jgi:hypothetical protein
MLRKLRNNMILNIPWEWRAWQPWKERWQVGGVAKDSDPCKEKATQGEGGGGGHFSSNMYISWILSFGLLQETRLMVWAFSSETRIPQRPWTLFSYAIIAYISLSLHVWEVLSSPVLFFYCTAATQFCWICWQIVIIALMWSISQCLKRSFLVDQNLGTLRLLEIYLNLFLWLVSNLSLLISKWKCSYKTHHNTHRKHC